MFAEEAGAAGGAALATVALAGYRWSLAIGLTLLGLPTVVLTVSDNAWAIVAVSVVRGAGFAISVAAGGAVTATLIPVRRRGEDLAPVGVVSGCRR